jgi:hypothetical protein
MIDSISAFFILVTEFGSRIDGLFAFKVTLEKQIESARDTPWFDGSLGHFENKSRAGVVPVSVFTIDTSCGNCPV